MSDLYQLYGDPFSYYSGKVLAYLRFKSIPFEMILPSPQAYKEVIIPRTGVRYIPVLLTPDDVAVQDTTEIIDFLEQRFPAPSIYPATPKQRLTALLFELYGDEWLLLPAMHYRWRYNEDFALKEFGRLTAPEAPPEHHRAIGEKAAARFRGAMPALGITEATAAAIEAWYEAFLAHMNAHFAQHPYLLGTRPSIGDFGLFGPLYAHLYRDPESGALMKRKAPEVAAWVERMDKPDATAPYPGEILSDDQVPETLFPVLRRMFKEHWPVLIDTANRLDAWCRDHPGEDIPRAIGQNAFAIGKVQSTRFVFPYAQWMMQRPLDAYRQLRDAEKKTVNIFLDDVDGREALAFSPPCRVARENNKLVLA